MFFQRILIAVFLLGLIGFTAAMPTYQHKGRSVYMESHPAPQVVYVPVRHQPVHPKPAAFKVKPIIQKPVIQPVVVKPVIVKPIIKPVVVKPILKPVVVAQKPPHHGHGHHH